MTTTDTGPGPGRSSAPPIGFLLRTLDGLIEQRFDRTLGARGVTRRQWQLLNTISRSPASAASLDEAVAPFLDRAAGETAAQHLAPLVAQGRLSLVDDAYDLTAAGRTLFAHLATEVQATRALIMHGLADGEYQRTVATLATMIANLEEQG